MNPIEEAFSKIKGLLRKAEARTREALVHNQNRLCEISYSDPHETSNLYSQALQGGA